jgi:hypothetical protein
MRRSIPDHFQKLLLRAGRNKSNGKEGLTMRYEKPSIATIGTASSAIQNHGHKSGMADDANTSSTQFSTGSSYDLDE